MNVLVTGGAGFIGANLCATLLRRDDIASVRVLDDLSTGYARNVPRDDVEFFEGSILDMPLLLKAMKGCDAVVHLAAIPSVPRSIADPMASHEANARGTLNVLESARRCGQVHVVLASSSSVYGANVRLPKSEDMACLPMSPYAVSKLASENYAVSYARCYDLPVLPFRFFNVFGPLQAADHAYAAVIPAFVSNALAGAPLKIFGDGLQSRDFTYIDTLVAILVTSATERITAGPINLAFGSRSTVLEVVDHLECILGVALVREHLSERPGDVKHSQADNRRLRELFPGVEPIDLYSGLQDTVSWYSREGLLR